jgi:iron-sulfur cluster repair protein YtfE (RIC family)
MEKKTLPADLDLSHREGLPDALRALIAEFPRAGWEDNPNYSHLIAFWLDKHMSFRRLVAQLDRDAEAMLEGNEDTEVYKRKLHRFGSMLIGDLHGHHQIEDVHYFPVMTRLDTGASIGFDILEKDHDHMDGLLNGLAESANGVLQSPAPRITDNAAAFKKTLDAFAPLLDRHLSDEEELVVPVLLKYAPPEFR